MIDKKTFLTRSFSRSLSEMCPGVVRLEYYLQDDGKETAIIRCTDGSVRRVDVSGLDLRQTVDAILEALGKEVA